MSPQGPAPDRHYRSLALGFYVSGEAELAAGAEALLYRGSNWQRLFAINLLCRAGNFSQLDQVRGILFDSRETLIWQAGVNILGAAGSWQAIEDFVAHLGDRIRTMWVRFYVAILFGMSCDRRAVDRLLELYAIGTDPEEDLDQTLRELSFLLEPADLEIFEARHDQPEQAGLVGLVQPLRRFVETLGEGKIFEAETLDLVRLAERLAQRLRTSEAASERFYRGRLIFEAGTGVDCSAFFNEEGRVNRLAAMAVIEGFLDSDAPDRFQPGRRYFFGHPIPD